MKYGFLIFLTSILINISFTSVLSQSVIIDNYVKEAMANNLNIQSEFLKKEKQNSKVDQAKKLWKPTLDLNASYLFAEGGRELLFPIGDLFNPVYGTLNQVTGSNDFPTDVENQNIQLTPNNYLDLQLSISKPLINSTIKYNQQIQKALLDLNDVDISLNKTEIAYQVRVGYFNYLKTIEGLSIIAETEKLLNEVQAFNKKLIKYDKATADILSDVEFQIANLESQRALVTEQQQLAKAYFNLLLNKDLEAEIIIDENVLLQEFDQNYNLAALKTKALRKRLEFRKIEVGTKVNRLNEKRIEDEKKPTVGVFGGVGLQTESFNFSNGGPLFTLGIGMEWSILDGGLRKKKIEEVKIDQKILDNDKLRLSQQVEIEVLQIFYKIKSLQVRMQSEKVAVQSARKSYNAIKKRYKNDKAILIELIQAQNSLTTSEMTRALTKYDYMIQRAELEKVVGGI